MRRRIATITLAILGVLGLGCPRVALTPAYATSWVALSIQELATRAERVVRARVTAVEVARDPDGRLFTRVEAHPAEYWKGAPPESPGASRATCEWVAGGGLLGDRLESSDAQAQYAVGDEVVVFLVRNPAGDWVTVGLAQGRFKVRPPARAGETAQVFNPFWGDEGVAAPAGTGVRLPSRRPLPLDELRRSVREVVP